MADGPPTWTLTRDVLLVDGIAVDRLLVSGSNVLAALESSRAIWETYRLRILDAPKGAGKTYALARLTRGRRLTA